MTPKRIAALIVVFFTIATILHVIEYYSPEVTFAPLLLTAFRWLVCAGFIAFAWKKKNLTAWIVASMFIGCEVGFTFPDAALRLNVLSGIFLRLIKTIISPLLFATLVVGIAAHSNLKQVGRMGLKAILYFRDRYHRCVVHRPCCH